MPLLPCKRHLQYFCQDPSGRLDIEGIASCLQRLSQLVTDFPQISEMDINPLIVGEVGTDPVVADARITLSKPHQKEPSEFQKLNMV